MTHGEWLSDKPGARCDYICLPVGWANSKIHSLNLPDLDAGKHPLSIILQLEHGAKQPSVSNNVFAMPLTLERSNANWKSTVMNFSHDYKLSIGTAMSINTQHRFSDITTQWLATHCGRGDRAPRAEYITSETWENQASQTDVGTQFSKALRNF